MIGRDTLTIKKKINKKTTVVREDEDLNNFNTHSIATIMTETLPVNNAEGNNIFSIFQIICFPFRIDSAVYRY